MRRSKQRAQEVRAISPRVALKGCRWVVGFDFGSHFEVESDQPHFRTLAAAERRADYLNRELGCSPSGTQYEVARIDYALTD